MVKNYLLAAGTSYLLGSINIGVLVSKDAYKDDVRKHGSGNAGATNMARTFGIEAGVITLAGDMSKAIISMKLGNKIAGQKGFLISGISCMIGHCWPVFYNFKGGKGISSGAGIAMMISPKVLSASVATFAIGALTSKKVSVGSIMASIMVPASSLYFKVDNYKLSLAVLAGSLAIYRHSPNIKRLINGSEPDFHFAK